MSEYIRVFSMVIVMVTAMIQTSDISVFSRSTKYLKEDIEIAVHDAALQKDEKELSNGRIVIDEYRANETFKQTFEKNTGMQPNEYEMVDFKIFDDSNTNFPKDFNHPTFDIKETFDSPTVFVVVRTTTSSYYNSSEDRDITRAASYTYKVKDLEGIDVTSIASVSEATASSTLNYESKDGFYWPVPHSKNITSNFGNRVHPISGEKKLHTGIDIAAAQILNKPTVSVLDGKVIFSGKMSGYGNIVIINHSNGLQTRYAHLNYLKVKRGDIVKKGEIIGGIGSTGNSTGPHLHFEVRVDNKPLDPIGFF